MIPTLKPVYEPQNSLRLITGFCMGIVLAVLLVTLWSQTLWTDTKAESILSRWKQLFGIFLIEIVAGILIWLDIPILYFPVAVLSIGTILLILSMVYTMLWIIILNKENSIEKFSKGVNFYLLGLLTALLQIGIMDILRYSIFGSWSGIQF